jgi:DNA-binding NtrC family response regulator
MNTAMSQFLISDMFDAACDRCASIHLHSLLQQFDPQATIAVSAATDNIDFGSTAAPSLHILRLRHWSEALTQSLALMQAHWPSTPTIAVFCAADQNYKDILAGLRGGLNDYVTCPVTSKDLMPRLHRLCTMVPKEGLHTVEPFSQAGVTSSLMVGQSPPFTAIIKKIPLLAGSDVTVLITGETGTGKELVARAIHYRSTRRGHPFIALNCSAVPDILFENELFGHMQGAYTDARQTEPGLVEEAEGGTLFLDEIDSLSRSGQAKLLRFIQHREYRPIGSARTRQANVRLLVATNADLRQRIRTGEFREDLFHRINVMDVTLPPLRQRASDIPLLARHFLHQYQTDWDGKERRLTPDAMTLLLHYDWPGNVRELESVLQRAIMHTTDPVISAEALDLPIAVSDQQTAPLTLRQAKQRAAEACEKSYVVCLLTNTHGNISLAARQARIDRRALQRLLHKHQVDRHTFNTTEAINFPVMPEK